MSEFPNGWVAAEIGSLCSLENGRAFKPNEWSTKGLPIVRIQNLNKPLAPYNYFEGEFADRYFLRGGELLFAWSGTPSTSFGAHVWRGGKAVLNQHIFRVDFNEAAIDKRFFRLAINQKLNELINVAHGGVGLRHVTKGVFESTEIALAPLPEQKRIADKLDAVLARVDACRDRLDRLPAILKCFRQSVLAAATSGKLTVDWREENSITCMWVESTLLSLTTKITDGEHITPKRSPSGKYLLSARNIQNGSIALGNVDYVDDLEFDRIRRRCNPEIGDVLLSCSGSVGRAAMVDRDNCYVMVRSAAMIRPRKDLLHTTYLMYCLQSPNLQVQIEAKSKATAQANIFLGAIKELVLPLPGLQEQTEIVRRVEALFAFADRLEARYTAARAQVEKLTPATLAKAFRGELVPQDPNDEPASVLLECIRNKHNNQSADKPKRGRQSPQTKSKVA